MRQIRCVARFHHGRLGYRARLLPIPLPECPTPASDRLRTSAAAPGSEPAPSTSCPPPTFALDAADAGGAAAFIHLRHRLRRAEDLVQIAHRTLIGIAGIGAAHARRIGHHRLQLLPQRSFRLAQQNGVAVRLRHLAAIGAGKLRRRRQQRLRLGKDELQRCGVADRPAWHLARIELIESAAPPRASAPRAAPGLRPREQSLPGRIKNVRRLQQRISEKSVGPEVLVLDVLALLFVAGHALQPTQAA